MSILSAVNFRLTIKILCLWALLGVVVKTDAPCSKALVWLSTCGLLLNVSPPLLSHFLYCPLKKCSCGHKTFVLKKYTDLKSQPTHENFHIVLCCIRFVLGISVGGKSRKSPVAWALQLEIQISPISHSSSLMPVLQQRFGVLAPPQWMKCHFWVYPFIILQLATFEHKLIIPHSHYYDLVFWTVLIIFML